jgi:hypothetical protein
MKLAGISYVSPVVRFDADARVVVVQHRDPTTGEVSRQVPSQEAVRDLRMDVLTGAAVKPAPPPEKRTADAEQARGGEAVSLTV